MSYTVHRLLLTTIYSLGSPSRNIRINRILCGNHYETLKLPRNCTTKDVRDSFIKLSKQCHPDKNQNDPTKHSEFVKLNEAYHILSRPDKRRAYDLTLKPESMYSSRHESTPFDVSTTAYRQRVVWKDESFWESQDKTRYDNNKDGDYYGIKGLKRLHNGWIAVLCIVFSAIGVCLQILLIQKSAAFNRQHLDDLSQQTSRVLSEVQHQAMIHGNKVQLERVKQRLTASQTSNQEPIQQGQEISNWDTQNTTHP